MNYKTLVGGMNTFTSTYGHCAGVLLRNIALQYELETTQEVVAWDFRLYECGLVLPCPSHIDNIQAGAMGTVDYAQTFIKAAARTCEALAEVEEDEDDSFSLLTLHEAISDATVIRAQQ